MTQKSNLSRLLLPLVLVMALVTTVPAAHAAPLLDASARVVETEQEIKNAMARWIAAVTGKTSADLVNLVDFDSALYYLRLRDLALTANADELSQLSEVDQLQVMFFRLMVDGQQLRIMSAQQLLAFAVEKGFIGMELRRGDLLDDIRFSDDTATGRLLKFGRADRPDRYRQYLVKEQGGWRVSLQGERERLEGEFDGFVQRSGLSRSEAAFLILEMRVMRKVSPSDFYNPAAGVVPAAKNIAGNTRSADAAERFRLVSVRLPESVVGRPAVTLDDTETGLKLVLKRGESVPGYPLLRLQRIAPDAAVFEMVTDSPELVSLPLDPVDRLTRRSVGSRAGLGESSTVFDEARLGANYPGQMMMQWRNIGLRGRPQLLQQAWLTPDFGGALGPDKLMLGLKVSQVVPASFWDQIGLENGDLLKELNGVTIDTLDAWKKVLQIAQREQELTVRVQRGDHEVVFRTRTVRPV